MDAIQVVKEAHTPQIPAQLSDISKVVMMLAKDKYVHATPRPFVICTQVGYSIDIWPQLQEDME